MAAGPGSVPGRGGRIEGEEEVRRAAESPAHFEEFFTTDTQAWISDKSSNHFREAP